MTFGTLPLRTVVWRPLAVGSEHEAEHCTLRKLAKGFRLEGHVVTAVASGGSHVPLHVHYIVDSDAAWRTRAVSVSQHYGLVQSTLRLDVINMRWWTAEGIEIPQLHWLIDVDLGVTPATNTLPIRRLGLDVGQHADVTAAWLRFPALTIEPLPQTYERLAPNLYRYTSNGGLFSALLETDEFGMVVHYEGGWECVAAA
jgi:uncharacterized protein